LVTREACYGAASKIAKIRSDLSSCGALMPTDRSFSNMATSRLMLSAVAGIALAPLLAVPASAMPISQPQTAISVPSNELLQQVQWRGRGYGYGYPGYYGGYRRNNGAAVAAGVLGGLALGAVIAGAAGAPPPVAYAPGYAPPPPPGDWYAYCASKYQSFDPASGTYLGYDGFRHPCQ
jgi:hypothetical protein